MVTLRCTAKVLRRLGLHGASLGDSPPSTGVLGDWYVDLLVTRHVRIAVFVAEASRLPVVVQGSPFAELVPRFQRQAVEVLRALGVSSEAVEREARAMRQAAFARTRSRSLLGTLNDYFRQLRWLLGRPELTCLDLSLHLSRTPSGPMRYESPDRVTRALMDRKTPAHLM
jgi:hypothetical protein